MSKIPNEWTCPITHQLMQVPVIAEDGITYEESAITKWLNTPSSNNRSPVTNTRITLEGLTVNYALKSLIERFVQENNVVVGNPPPQKISDPIVLNTSSITAKRFKINDKSFMHIKVKSPNTGDKKTTLVIAAIDISGSMGSNASLEKEGNYQFSRLDLVKHSLRTIVDSMNETDYIALVPFSTAASILLQPTQLDESMKQICCNLIDELKPTNTTNIWDALKLSFDIASHPDHENKNISILLFTDGEPNVNPPRGIIPTMNRKLETINQSAETQNVNFTINTFGFGYQLDSLLLRNIANYGKGQFSFIPDASMVGTVFVNFISNVLLNYSTLDKLTINSSVSSNEIIVDSLQYGQDKDFIVEDPHNIDKIISYNGSNYTVSSDLQEVDMDSAYHYVRFQLVNIIGSLVGSFDNSYTTVLDNFHSEMFSKFSGSDQVSELLKDIKSSDINQGQIMKAVESEDWYNKWGKHYLLSIQRAHECQVCNNFKDPGVQLYGGQQFSVLRDKIEENFCNLPAPKPSIKLYSYRSGNSGVAYTPPTNMGSYMNSGGGCFDGNSIVLMDNNETKYVKNIVKGDVLFNNSKIRCVVKTKVYDDIDLCTINNMLITPWHPICMDKSDNWQFPIKIVETEKRKIYYVYNLVLESGHYAMINNIKVVTLGHNFTNNNVIQHNYYGSDKVITDLMKFEGWDEGLVLLDKPHFERDVNGKISNISV